VDTVILPSRNEPDLEDIPSDIREAMTFILAERVEDVLDAALEDAPPAKKTARAAKNGKSGT